MFEIKNITKKYQETYALHDVSLTMNTGLNFIVGSSGSGKTTLLKILSGMEQAYDGDVLYGNKNINELSPQDKSYFYNNIFGFIWQEFHLHEDSTVLENVLVPAHLKRQNSQQNALKILKSLKIQNLATKKVKHLSGGQKQRVAIARELMKNPQVIFADEPTSALDEKSAKTTMDILRTLSKTRTVIVVTHDTSLIAKNDTVFELDKGELITTHETVLNEAPEIKMQNRHRLSLKNAFTISKSNIKNKFLRFVVSIVTLLMASVLLLTTLSGAIVGSSQNEFNKLIDTYGQSLCDLSIINSFTDASGTDNKKADKPNGDVQQDIRGIYDLYANDPRVSFSYYLQAFENINISIDGKNHSITSSGSSPSMNKLLAGAMPKSDTFEVVVPQSFVTSLGITMEQALGKEIQFSGSIYNWSSGQPDARKVTSKVKIVGIIDTTAKYEYEGKVQEYTIDDAFIFSKVALASMNQQAGTDINKQNFVLRATSPATMIAIKDELSAKGIVPLGRFELVEDMVRLNTQTTEQSSLGGITIAVLSIVMVISIFFVTSYMKKREYAIYKISGFTTTHLCITSFTESIYCAITAIFLMLITSPLINMATTSLFGVTILHIKMLFIGIVILLGTTILAYLATILAFIKLDVPRALKVGDK